MDLLGFLGKATIACASSVPCSAIRTRRSKANPTAAPFATVLGVCEWVAVVLYWVVCVYVDWGGDGSRGAQVRNTRSRDIPDRVN